MIIDRALNVDICLERYALFPAIGYGNRTGFYIMSNLNLTSATGRRGRK